MPESAKNFRFLRLGVWPEKRKLYRLGSGLGRKFPREELFGLTLQMRRSARSVCADITEGGGRNPDRGFAQFVEKACGSAAEVASVAYRAFAKGYLPESERDELLAAVEIVVAKASGLCRKLSPGAAGAPRSALRAPRNAGA